jgi:hypothetical protein
MKAQNIVNPYKLLHYYWKEHLKNQGSSIRFYNFWEFATPQEVWFYRFLIHRNLINGCKKKVNFYSVLGPLDGIKYRRFGIDIFYTGENIYADRFHLFQEYIQKHQFDFSLGFDPIETETYIRHPLWIHYLFEPESSFSDIQIRLEQLSHPLTDKREQFCSIVAGHDWNGIRTEMIDTLQSIDFISSAGKFRNNTDELAIKFNNEKHPYIQQFKFNLCPENSNAEGYVTEKLFQAIAAGCIPIYWGSNNQPEKEILNQQAILFWNQHGDNQGTIKTIRELHEDETKYIEFISQPRFLPNAAEVIWSYFQSLDRKLSEIIQNH